MHAIEIDDDVFAELQRRARPLVDSASDVIRRLLDERDEALSAENDPADDEGTMPRPTARPGVTIVPIGKLKVLVDKGLVGPGDRLVHNRKRTGEVFEAFVSNTGCVRMPDGTLYKEPSPALRHYTGSQIDGWAYWVHEPSGRSLRDLRDNG